MIFTGNQFKTEVYRFWSEKLGISPELMEKKGSLITVEEELDATTRVIIYHIKDLYFIRIGKKTIKALGLSSGFSGDKLYSPTEMKNKIYAQGFNLKNDQTLLDFFLDPKDFIRAHKDGQVRLLDNKADMISMQALFSVCTSAELDDAEIYVDNIDPVNFGIFEDGKIIAYSSYRMFGEHICDPGVLVHPDYRNKGLGKAVISALCEYCFENDIIPMYRVFEWNVNSIKIPQSLGFRLLLTVNMLTLNES